MWLKKDLPRLVRSLLGVLLIGSSRCLWECEQKVPCEIDVDGGANYSDGTVVVVVGGGGGAVIIVS